MDNIQATALWDHYAQQDDAVDLSFRQIDTVVTRLMKLSSATITHVAYIIKQEFPEMFRPSSQQRTQQQRPTQTRKEMEDILGEFLNNDWARLTGGAFLPLKSDSEINFKAFSNLLNAETVIGTGTTPVSRIVLSDITVRLFAQGLLERPRIVERIVEVEKTVPRTRKQEQRHDFELDRKMNAPGVDAIKGASDQAAKKPVATTAQLESQARHDLRENEIMGDVRSIISGHTHSGSHAATRYEREILTNVMNDSVRKNLSAEAILANVKAQQNVMAKWGTQDALRQLRPELFTAQPKAAY